MTTKHTRQLQPYTQDILKYNMYKGKQHQDKEVKVIPLQARCGPEGG